MAFCMRSQVSDPCLVKNSKCQKISCGLRDSASRDGWFQFGVKLEDIYGRHELDPTLNILFRYTSKRARLLSNPLVGVDCKSCQEDKAVLKTILQSGIPLDKALEDVLDNFFPATILFVLRNFCKKLPVPVLGGYLALKGKKKTFDMYEAWKEHAQRSRVCMTGGSWQEEMPCWIREDMIEDLQLLSPQAQLFFRGIMAMIRDISCPPKSRQIIPERLDNLVRFFAPALVRRMSSGTFLLQKKPSVRESENFVCLLTYICYHHNKIFDGILGPEEGHHHVQGTFQSVPQRGVVAGRVGASKMLFSESSSVSCDDDFSTTTDDSDLQYRVASRGRLRTPESGTSVVAETNTSTFDEEEADEQEVSSSPLSMSTPISMTQMPSTSSAQRRQARTPVSDSSSLDTLLTQSATPSDGSKLSFYDERHSSHAVSTEEITSEDTDATPVPSPTSLRALAIAASSIFNYNSQAQSPASTPNSSNVVSLTLINPATVPGTLQTPKSPLPHMTVRPQTPPRRTPSSSAPVTPTARRSSSKVRSTSATHTDRDEPYKAPAGPSREEQTDCYVCLSLRAQQSGTRCIRPVKRNLPPSDNME